MLVVTIGAFGDRFAKIAGAFGADVDRFEVEWGTSASPAALRMHLDGSDPYRAVLITHNETSTGVANPLRELAEVVRGASEEPLLIVDGISGLGAMPFEMDDWGVDLVISASQKAWMASPGIAIAALGPRAVAAGETATMPRVYWDFAEAREWAGKGQTPWTPAITVLYGLRVGVQRLRAEGRERTWARHASIAAAVGAGLETLGLRLVAAPHDRSATVTAAWLPEGIEWAPFNADMRSRGLVIAGGQGKWAGQDLPIRAHGRGRHRRDGRGDPHHGRDAPGDMDSRPMRPRHRPPHARSSRPPPRRRGDPAPGLRPSRRHRLEREGRWQGRLDPPLSERGRREAQMVAGRLAADPDLRPARILSSTLARASETAAIIGGSVGVEPEPDARLVEIGAGEWEGRTHAELAAIDGERYRRLARRRPGTGRRAASRSPRPPSASGRSSTDVAASDTWPVLLVSHGGTLRILARLLLDLSAERAEAVDIDNASVSSAVRSGGGTWRLERWNDELHLLGRERTHVDEAEGRPLAL